MFEGVPGTAEWAVDCTIIAATVSALVAWAIKRASDGRRSVSEGHDGRSPV
jgi:hypothetical protein